jgi:bleomycin hydrolase
MNWAGWVAGCWLVWSGVAQEAAGVARDAAFYKDFSLSEREIQEEDARDKAQAVRRGLPYKPGVHGPENRLTLDFSKLERPRTKEEFRALGHLPPKRQWWTGNCWCFAATSLMESEVQRQSQRQIKLSELHTVYWEFVEKAREYVRTKGASLFDEGSEFGALVLRWQQYGAVPEEAYPGLVGGATVFDQGPLMEEAQAYLTAVKAGGHWDEATVTGHIRTILDRHLGRPPEKVDVDGVSMTPKEYLERVLRIDPGAYVEVMSFLYVPFWTQGEYKAPDNYWHATNYYNVPLEDWYGAMRQAVALGYTVAIGGDTSEVGFESREDVAIVPTFDIPPGFIDQAAREFRWANKTSGDDHGIHVVGVKRLGVSDWFLVKDSGRGAQRGVPGYMFYREDYVRLKMLTFMVHRDGVRDILARFAGETKKAK